MLKKATLQEIKHSLGRYIAIVAIVILGVGFFAGLKVAKTDMVATADDYLISSNFYDYQLISTLGFTDKNITKIAQDKNVENAEGSISSDILYQSYDNVDRAIRVISVPSKINTLQITAGRLPKKSNECIVDYNMFQKKDIGKTIVLSSNNDKDDLKKFKYKKYKIVGICNTPLYLNYERGSTSIGNGSLNSFMFIPKSGFDVDYYTDVYVDLNNQDQIYSTEYNNYIDSKKDTMENLCKVAANERYDSIVKKAEDKLASAKRDYEKGLSDYNSSKNSTYSKLASAKTSLESSKSKIANQEKKLKTNKSTLEKNKKKVESALSQIPASRAKLEAGKAYMKPKDYIAAKAKIDGTEKSLKSSLIKINSGLAQVKSGEKSIKSAKAKLEQGRKEYASNKAKADAEFSKAKEKLDNAYTKIQEGQSDIKKIKKPKTYVMDRSSNIGYVCFENDSGLIEGIAKVFPFFFFLVAALVCMTTMTRMVDENRTQIGVFKALGYSNGAIMSEYLFYSGSAALIGAIIGFFGGGYLFPKVIWAAYGMMYYFNPNLHYVMDWKLGTISLLAAMVCSMGSTYISCRNDFRIVPAELIRPKAPKNGKRILLEYITPIWNKLGFLYKVTLRNIFRYKKRFLMMVLGISGCTALLLTGFGINDSVKNIVEFQYDEIMTYDYSITFDDPMNSKAQKDFTKESSKYIDSIYYLSETAVDFIKGKDTKSVKMIVSDGKDIGSFINLHDDKNKSITYPKDGQVVICSELADRYNCNVGDKITLRNSDHDSFDVTVSGICENYIYNYVYVNPKTCQDGLGKVPDYKTAIVKSKDNSREGVSYSSAKVQGIDNVVATAVNNDMRDRVNSMMTSMDAVILLVIMSAGALAFVVLYNLTNINITERIREIATIKVLGFYPSETSAYVFRENFILTGISAIVGLFLGKWLHAFVMAQLKIDLISFDVRINTVSYIYSIVLTFAFAIIVSVVMYFKLNRINMAESLKSIE